MRTYQLDQIEEKLDELERFIVRSGAPKKYIMDMRSLRNVMPTLRKEAEKNER